MPLALVRVMMAMALAWMTASSAAFARPPKQTAPAPTATAATTPPAAPPAPPPPTAAPPIASIAPAATLGQPTGSAIAAPPAPVASASMGSAAGPTAPDFSSNEIAASGKTARPKQGVHALLDGWSSLKDTWMLLDMFAVLLLALGLGATIAYHPSIRRRHSTLEQYEQPKTLLMYAVVAAVVALIVEVQPAMAFVIFGIGGLLRFRTDVGEAKDTGRVILVTVVGLCCGLKIPVVAFPATIIGWILIWALERQLVGTIRVSGVSEQSMQEAPRAYRDLIQMAGCTVIAEQTKFMKREFEFVVAAPVRMDRSAIQSEFDKMPGELRGVVVWEGL